MQKTLETEIIQYPFGEIVVQSTKILKISDIMGAAEYHDVLAEKKRKIIFGLDVGHSLRTYRDKMLESGHYLGHHVGEELAMSIVDDNIYVLSASDNEESYKKFFWTYLIKLILTFDAINNDSLHLKGTAIVNPKTSEAILIMGRGGSGKTTLCNNIIELTDYFLLSNTHLIVKDNKVWGINSWRRHRDEKHVDYYEKPNENYFGGPYKIKHVFFIDKNDNGVIESFELSSSTSLSCMNYFSAAISNYDLKEDIVDYLGNMNFDKKFAFFEKERNLLEKFINTHKLFYLNYDNNLKDNNFLAINCVLKGELCML